jgi:hypothetical protein
MQVAGTHRWATDIANLMVISQWHGSKGQLLVPHGASKRTS